MSDSLVSVLFPVYNSSDFARSGGKCLLEKALDSLLTQKYNNIELIILDNQSTDNTAKICRSYADKDSRVRYVLDDQQRFPEEAISWMAQSLMRGKYCMIGNDDDLYSPEYISEMVAVLEGDDKIGMAYANGRYVDVDGVLLSKMVPKIIDSYSATASAISSYCVYIQKRNILPIIFGVYRSEVMRRLLPFEKFDELKANVDNLFMAKFFIKGHKCFFVDKELFFYRDKKRGLSEVQSSVKIPGMPDISKPILLWMYYIRHQFYFFNKLNGLIRESQLHENQYTYVHALTYYSFLKQSINLLGWIKKEYIRTASHEKIYNEFREVIRKKMKQISRKPLSIGFFPDDRMDNARFQPEVLSDLVAVCLKGGEGMIELIRRYEHLNADEGVSPIIAELKTLFEEEQKRLGELKNAADSRCGQKPLLLNDTTSNILPGKQSSMVSIISPSLNLGRFLQDTITSVSRQSYSNFEHLVVDGGSTDETLDVLKRNNAVRYISEPDDGVAYAIRKGFLMSKGNYIIVSCVSDGILDKDWLHRCVELLDNDQQVALVWGFPQYLSEDGALGSISYPQFHHTLAPQKNKFFAYWIQTKFWLPESNFCVRREIFDKCFPSYADIAENKDCFLEFNYNLHVGGYLTAHIPVVASFGRTHSNQAGQRETQSGLMKKRMSGYRRKVLFYQLMLLSGIRKHTFRNGFGCSINTLACDGVSIRDSVRYRLGYIKRALRKTL
ncbi:MAG: glycosyltransferase [Chlorobiaceae bacterium]